jgi:hypothetical protein
MDTLRLPPFDAAYRVTMDPGVSGVANLSHIAYIEPGDRVPHLPTHNL